MSLKWKLILGSIFLSRSISWVYVINGKAHVPFNEDAVLASLIQDSERCVCVVVFLFVKCRKKDSCIFQWICPQLGRAPKEAAHHEARAPEDWTVGTDAAS